MPRFDLSTLKKVDNAQFLKAVADMAPEFKSLVSKTSAEVFTESGFQALKSIHTPDGDDPVTRFYGIAVLVGAQYVDFVSGRDVLGDAGILRRIYMPTGGLMQKTIFKRHHNTNPGWLGADGTGLKDGDSPDQYEVRKMEMIQYYWGLNWNYQNWFTLQNFDLKGGWIRMDGISDVVAQMYNIIALDRKDTEMSKFLYVLSGAVQSTEYPLQDTQVMEIEQWESADALPDKDAIEALIVAAKDTAESIESMPATDAFNAAGALRDEGADDMVLYLRNGFKSRMETVLGYAFNDEKLQFPFEVKSLPTFGGQLPYLLTDPDDPTSVQYLQPVYTKNGVVVGWIDITAVINGDAHQRGDGKWIVNITSGGVTADTTIYEGKPLWEDPLKDCVAILAQRGLIFEIIQNEMRVRVVPNARGEYDNVWFNQMNNGINYDHTRNLIIFTKKQSA